MLRDDWKVLAVVAGLVVVVVSLAVFVWLPEDQRCRDAGGEPTRAGCLKKDAFVK
jgi:hypothetical protein